MRLLLPGPVAARALAGVAAFGGGLGLAFLPGMPAALALAALAALCAVWDRAAGVREAFRAAWAGHCLAYVIAFGWVGRHPMAATAAASLAALPVLALFPSLAWAVGWWVRRRLNRAWGLAAVAVSTALLERLLQQGPLAMPWAPLGLTAAESPYLLPLAAVGGVQLLSAWMPAAAACAYLTLTARVRRVWPATALLLVLAAPAALSRMLTPAAPSGSIVVGLAQPGLAPLEWAEGASALRLGALGALTEALLRAGPPPAFVVWPETALRLGLGVRAQLPRLAAAADSAGAPLLAGAVLAGAGGALYNVVVAQSGPGRPLQWYAKQRLVPYAEVSPFAGALPLLEGLRLPSGGAPGYAPGDAPGLLDVAGARVGVLICFESIFPDAVRELARGRAQLIVVVAQTGWWGRSAAYGQHLRHAALRAAESGRAVVQATVSGGTAVVLPTGARRYETAWMQRAALRARVPLYAGATPYVRWGGWVDLAFAFALAGMGAAAFYAGRRRHLRPRPPCGISGAGG